MITPPDSQNHDDSKDKFLQWKNDQIKNNGTYKEIIEQTDQLAELEMELQEFKKMTAVREFEEEMQKIERKITATEEAEQRTSLERQKSLELEELEKKYIDQPLPQDESVTMRLLDVLVKIGHFIEDIFVDTIVKPIALGFCRFKSKP